MLDAMKKVLHTHLLKRVAAWVDRNPHPALTTAFARREICQLDLAVCTVTEAGWKLDSCGDVIVNMIVNDEISGSVYRISIRTDGVDVLCLGLESVDSELEGSYDGVHVLPDWVQERIALLMMTKAEPPTHEVVGVGRRISQNVFWVYSPER